MHVCVTMCGCVPRLHDVAPFHWLVQIDAADSAKPRKCSCARVVSGYENKDGKLSP